MLFLSLCLNVSNIEVLGLTVMAWSTLGRQVVQTERPLITLFRQKNALHLKSLGKVSDSNMSGDKKSTTVRSITIWTKAKRQVIRSVDLGLGSGKRVKMQKKRTMVLAKIPMPAWEKKHFFNDNISGKCVHLNGIEETYFVYLEKNNRPHIISVHSSVVKIITIIITFILAIYY